MGFLQSQNLTLGSTQPEVIYLESTSQLLPSVDNTFIVLGLLTFALQLCLLLFLLLRYWRFDNSVAEALKHPDTANKLLVPSSVYPDIYKQASYQLFDGDTAASWSPAVSAGDEPYETNEPSTHPLFAPVIPWDLVQC